MALVARYAGLVAGPDHHLTRGQHMRMDRKGSKGQLVTVDQLSELRILVRPLAVRRSTPRSTTATMRLNASGWCSLGLVFIAISRLASLRAESHMDLLKGLGQE